MIISNLAMQLICYFRNVIFKYNAMKTIFRYFLLLLAFILPIFLLLDHNEKFFILIGVSLGITIAYWVGIYMLHRRNKHKE